ncbi:MAG: phosphatidylglycerophosphatase A [Chitinivibrionales bacterium]|nr:phosphatidylglycerophosphatase A [Chitinivibrionales bacterium]
MKGLVNFVQRAGASCLFLGYIPYMPGTFGSLPAVALAWFGLSHFGFRVLQQHAVIYWFFLLAITGIAVLFSSRAKTLFGRDDDGRIVIDEFAGQLITFFMVPLSVKTLIAGFFLFRFFDIIKPYPVYRMEELEGGLGVVMDDVVAGILANATLLLIVFAFHAVERGLHII